MDRVNRDDSTFTQTAKRADDYRSARCKSNRTIEFHGRFFILLAYPGNAERGGSLAVRFTARYDIHLTVPGMQNGNGQAGGTSKAKKSNAFARLDARYAQASETNDSSTE